VKQIVGELWLELEAAEEHLADAEAKASAAEQRFAAAGDLVARLFAEEKRQRILAAHEQWLQLLAASIATVAGALQGYVWEVPLC